MTEVKLFNKQLLESILTLYSYNEEMLLKKLTLIVTTYDNKTHTFKEVTIEESNKTTCILSKENHSIYSVHFSVPNLNLKFIFKQDEPMKIDVDIDIIDFDKLQFVSKDLFLHPKNPKDFGYKIEVCLDSKYDMYYSTPLLTITKSPNEKTLVGKIKDKIKNLFS
ncbi:MAG: hypothetical protein [Bacteriophage sp.]|nr:MAG: hypothetical protein [Bacteriophage sp.]